MEQSDYAVDILIPVYNALKDFKRCADSILRSPTNINYRIIIINDGSNKKTTEYINELNLLFPNVEVLHNDKNIGYLKSINLGLLKHVTKYKICLNSDVIVTENWIDKLITAAESDPTIGLVVPMTTNATTLTIKPPNGSNFLEVSKYISTASKKKYPPACTVIGFCLLITQEVINRLGSFDESFDPGYYEECDYQYKAKELGYRAIICDDCYIYHKGQGSFKDRKQNLIQKNKTIFHNKWENEYRADYKIYDDDNALGYLRDRRSQKLIMQLNPIYDIVFILPFIPTIGTNDIIAVANELILEGLKVGLITIGNYDYVSLSPFIVPHIFSSLQSMLQSNIKSKIFVSTHPLTVPPMLAFSNKAKAKSVCIISDFEHNFDAELLPTILDSYKSIPNKIVISKVLQDKLKNIGFESEMIILGVDTDIFYPNQEKPKAFSVAAYSSPEEFDTIKKAFKLIVDKDDSIFCSFFGPKKEMDFNYLGLFKNIYEKANILSSSHVCINLESKEQPFNFLGLESMACNCVFLSAQNTGISDYATNKNIIFNSIEDSNAIASSVLRLKNNPLLYESFIKEGIETVRQFNFKNTTKQFLDYFLGILNSNYIN